jgi:citrate lyase subunit beta/citryl-CoA lyase
MASSSWLKALSRPRFRSTLFVPGSNARAMEKARALSCDAVILDLEDAVGDGAKQAARAAIRDAVAARAFGARPTLVRINAPSSEAGAEDIRAAADADAILIPKVQGPADLAAARLLAGQTPREIPLWAMIETPAAVLALNAIAAEVAGLVLGANDLLKAMGGRHRPDRANLQAAMALTVTAARAHGRIALDSVHNDLTDKAGFLAACALGRDFGFDGKTLVHPDQIAPAQRAFSPSPEEAARARRLLDTFALPQNRDKGVIAFEGAMVERLDAQMAQRLLDEDS